MSFFKKLTRDRSKEKNSPLNSSSTTDSSTSSTQLSPPAKEWTSSAESLSPKPEAPQSSGSLSAVRTVATFGLRGLKETTDVFTPLKSVTGALLFLIDNHSVRLRLRHGINTG